MADRVSIAQSEATVLYPAVSNEELQDEALLLTSYRRALGRERLLWGALGAGALAWLVDYVRRGK